MTPETILQRADDAQLWSPAEADALRIDVGEAYRRAIAVRALRIARGEQPRGFKIGFTNRSIWPRYGVFAPIWGTVYDTTLLACDGEAEIDLTGTCQPRIEPEAVFGMGATPPPGATIEQLFDCIEWLAPGFEIVQSHCAGWKFETAQSVADGSLHARLLVGPKRAIGEVAADATAFNASLASASVQLSCDGKQKDSGRGADVLDGPLFALRHFLVELRACRGGPDLMAGDVVTTGTWTDAWPLLPGQTWRADFSAPLTPLQVTVR